MSRKSILEFLSRFEARSSRGVLLLIQMLFGPSVAAGYFSYSPFLRRTERRAVWLHTTLIARFGPDAGRRLLVRYLSARPKPQHFRALLCRNDELRPSSNEVAELVPHVVASSSFQNSRLLGLLSALLERGEVELAVETILSHHRQLSSSGRLVSGWWRAIRPLLMWPGNVQMPPKDRDLNAADLVPGPAEHRLIVMDEALSPEMIRHLAQGAGKVTLLQFNELYGKLPLSAIQDAVPHVRIMVEHARTRVGRFSHRYNELHQRSRELAEVFVEPMMRLLGNEPTADERLTATLALADRLFFKALRMDGCLRAICSPDFDSVVVSTSRNHDLMTLVRAEPSAMEGGRVVIGCWSSNLRSLGAFPRQFAAATVRASADLFGNDFKLAPDVQGHHVAQTRVLLDREFPPQATIPGAPPQHSARIAIVTSANAAYLGSSALAALALGRKFDVDVIWTHGRIDNLRQVVQIAETNPVLASGGPVRTPRILALNKDPTSRRAERMFTRLLRAHASAERERIAELVGSDSTLRLMVGSEMQSDLPSFLLRLYVQFGRAERALRAGAYSAVLLCPVREPRNAVYIPAARRARIPTLTFEPHCLNSTYCRYSSVLTDYAALYSDHFVEEYARHFAIPADRSFIVGSPRILRPPGYDSQFSRRESRMALGIRSDLPMIVVATQPMPATHTQTVFREIVRAVVSLPYEVRLYVKPHPEENEADVALYRSIVDAERGGEIASVVDTNVRELMIASDLVIVYYSVTALEAAVLERNLLIAGRIDGPYPMEYDEIISVPRCTDAQAMRAMIEDTIANGRAAATGIEAFRDRHPYLYDNRVFDRLADAVRSIAAAGETGIREASTFPDQPFVTAEFREYLD